MLNDSTMSSPTSPDSGRYHELQSPGSMAPPTSSPTRRPSSYGANGRKERRNPSVTPRKFSRFFTPRSVQSSNVGSTRRSLFDATASTINRNGMRSSPIRRPGGSPTGQENSSSPFTRDMKRRKLVHAIEEDSCSDRSTTPCILPLSFDNDSEDKQDIFSSQTSLDSAINMPHQTQYKHRIELPEKKIKRIEDCGISGRLLHMNLGNNARSRRQHVAYPVAHYQDDTSRFYSRPEDVHACNIQRPNMESCIPFCTAACNTNTLVAVGDERGKIRLLESDKNSKPGFNDVYLSFQAHANAIIDMSFSQDDSLLATGSGDQRVQVMDMKTQQIVCDFEDSHIASVKAVRFQPGQANNSVLATCSRDGNIHIFDMRCRSSTRAAQNELKNSWITYPRSTYTSRVRSINSLIDAHRPLFPARTLDPAYIFGLPKSSAGTLRHNLPRTNPYSEAVSITSIAWMPEGREHLLLTSSELDSSVKLWDIRSIPRKKETATALSQTACPESHNGYRQVGLTSIQLSGDGSRLYAAARDNAVYVYNTSHLMLGRAPDMNISNKPRRSLHTVTQNSPGPMYAFRHPMLLIGSFYIKCAIRPARDGKPEMLAVGSTDSCAVLFPTDERHLESSQPTYERHYERTGDHNFNTTSTSSPRSRRLRNERAKSREEGKLEVSERGTALIEGHSREVSSVAWNSNGELIGVSDDAIVRVWREGRNGEARDLRTGGNSDGRRWGCGWADVSEGYDDEGSDMEIQDENGVDSDEEI